MLSVNFELYIFQGLQLSGLEATLEFGDTMTLPFPEVSEVWEEKRRDCFKA